MPGVKVQNLQTFSRALLPSSQYWVVEAESAEQFRAEMAGADIAIDSSVLVATGNMSSHLHIVDVYRPQPEADIR